MHSTKMPTASQKMNFIPLFIGVTALTVTVVSTAHASAIVVSTSRFGATAHASAIAVSTSRIGATAHASATAVSTSRIGATAHASGATAHASGATAHASGGTAHASGGTAYASGGTAHASASAVSTSSIEQDHKVFIGATANTTVTAVSTSRVEQEHTCDCVCRDSFMDTAFAHKPLCKVISRFEEELSIVKKEIEKKITFGNEIDALKDIVEEQGYLIKTLQEQVEKLSSSSIVYEDLPMPPASLVMKEDHMQENLNETRGSTKMQDDKLLKSTLPMDSRVPQVEEIVLLTLETMNKTLFEDHLKKLYYKVDGVVYKNETEKLDERLNHLEMELMKASNMNTTLKFPKEITDILSAMNQTIMGKLAEEEIRLASLENKTTKLDELEVLQNNMTNLLNKTKKLDELESLQDQTSVLLNVTEVMQTRAIDLWMDIQNVRNITIRLEKELHDQLSMTNRTVSSVQQEISGKLQTLAEELSSLKAEFNTDPASLPKLQADLKALDETDAISENRIRDLATALKKMTKEIAILKSVWNNSSSIPAAQEEPFKNSKDTDESDHSPKRITQSPGRQVRCRKPSINDEHLLVTLEEDSQGVQTLVFGCRPIGRYALEEGPVPVQCKNGFWHGPFPKCIHLKDEAEIIGR